MTDADEAANALGIWGVDLVNMGADLAMERTDPDSININARDATKTPRLANSAVVRTRQVKKRVYPRLSFSIFIKVTGNILGGY